MQVRYTLTLEDFVAFHMHVIRKLPSMRGRFYLTVCVLAIVLAASVVGAAFLGPHSPGAAIGLVVAAVAWTVVTLATYRHNIEQALRNFANEARSRGVFGPITLILTEESLTEITEVGRSEVRWANMKGVEVVGENTYIDITGLSFAIIPRHGFEREEDYIAVRDFVVRKLDSLP